MEISSQTERNLFELFKELNKNRIDYNIRKWETVKFFESIFTALIVATIGGIITSVKLGVIHNLLIVFGLILLPLCAIIALIFGIRHLKRESSLLYMEEGTMFKILKLIDLPERIPKDKRSIPGDEFLLPTKYRNYNYGIEEFNEDINFDDWLQLRTNNHKFSSAINLFFNLEIVLGLLLIISLLLYYILFI